jgi:putative ABC transport system permease protein
MFIIKNAVKNIYRYKNKYILFGVLYLVLILAASVCVALFVRMSAVTDNIAREYAGVVRLQGVGRGTASLPDRLVKEEYVELKNVRYIDDLRFLKYNFATSSLRENVSALEVEINIGRDITPVNTSRFEPVFISGYNLSLLYLALEDFNLESGRMFENDGEAVISKNSRFIPHSPRRWDEDTQMPIEPQPLADEFWNDLDLGDKITIKNADGIYKEFTIVGIQAENPDDGIHTNRRKIYTTLESAEYFDTIAAVEGVGTLGYSITPITEHNSGRDESNIIRMGYDTLVYLDKPENYYALFNYLINNDININGLYFMVYPLFSDFWALTSLARTIQVNMEAFMMLAAFLIIVVTIIVTIILLNNRKYEIAVLRSVGMKKSKLILSYLAENLAFIWSIAFVSLITAQFIAQPFVSRVLEGIHEFVSPEMFEQLTHSANIELILQNIAWVFGGTTAVVMLSLILACINIVRFEPLKIFNKRY